MDFETIFMTPVNVYRSPGLLVINIGIGHEKNTLVDPSFHVVRHYSGVCIDDRQILCEN